MPPMIGRIVSSAVTCGLLVSLCTCSDQEGSCEDRSKEGVKTGKDIGVHALATDQSTDGCSSEETLGKQEGL